MLTTKADDEGSRFIKPWLNPGGHGMGGLLGADFEQITSDYPRSSPQTGLVGWMNSQSDALQSLFFEVTEKPAKQVLKSETTWPGDDIPNPPQTNRSQTRPLRTESSLLRARLGSEMPRTSTPPPASDLSFWGSDRRAIIATCQNVSERMNEHAFDMVNNPDISNRPKETTSVVKTLNNRRNYSVPVISKQQDKGKQKANYASASRAHVLESHSTSPSYTSSSGSSSPTSFATNCPSTASTELTDTSMMDMQVDESIYATCAEGTTPLLDHASHLSKRGAPAPAVPASKLHPLLTRKDSRSRGSPNDKIQTAPQQRRTVPQSHPALPSSQNSRPPVLGMRRVHTAPISAPNNLPTRQKGFKLPRLSQPLPHVNSSHADMNSQMHQAQTRLRVQPTPQGRSNPAPMDSEYETSRLPTLDTSMDADSSYGDISFDLDELEATMRQYD